MRQELIAPKVLSEKDVLRKYGKRIYFKNYQMADGRVEDFLNFGATVIPVIGMPVTEKGNVVLVKQFRYGINGFIMEFPGGCIEPGQSPEDAIRAEVDQEIGYSCGEVIQLKDDMAFEPASVDVRFIPYLLTGCVHQHEPRLDRNEILQVVEIPLDEFLKDVHAGIDIDSKTAAVTLLALPYLGYRFTRG